MRPTSLFASLLFAIAGSVAFLPACSVLLDASTVQCSTADDCHKRGEDFANAVCVDHLCQAPANDARWACLGKPPATPPTTGTVAVTMEFYDPLNPTNGVPDISVRGCGRLDVGCATPIAAAVKSDTKGHATLTVPMGFDGYLEMTNQNMMPGLFYFSPKPTKPATYRIAPLTPKSFSDIAQAAGGTIDPASGHAFLFALDCDATFGTFAPGVSYASQQTTSLTRGFYLKGGLPNTAATETDASGIGGFANLPAGVVSVSSQVAATKTAIGSVGMLVRAGTITYAPIAPDGT